MWLMWRQAGRKSRGLTSPEMSSGLTLSSFQPQLSRWTQDHPGHTKLELMCAWWGDMDLKPSGQAVWGAVHAAIQELFSLHRFFPGEQRRCKRRLMGTGAPWLRCSRPHRSQYLWRVVS